MEATLCLSKPLHLFTSQTHKPTTLINRHHNVSFYNPTSFPVTNLSLRPHHQKMPIGPMYLSGPFSASCPEIVGMRDPMNGRRKRMVGMKRRVPSWRSLTLESLRRGSLPLKVLLEAKKARVNPKSLDSALSEFDELLSRLRDHQHRIEFYQLEEVARKLEMNRKEDEAVERLETLKNFLSSGSDGIGSHDLYVVKLLLVEMLIYQGEYKKARDICTEIEQEHKKAIESMYPVSSPIVPVELVGPTDYKFKLYQAVISYMLDETERARDYWDEFSWLKKKGFGEGGPKVTMDEEVDEDEEEGPPNTSMEGWEEDDEEDDHPLKFQQFVDHMRVLKQEIQAARK